MEKSSKKNTEKNLAKSSAKNTAKGIVKDIAKKAVSNSPEMKKASKKPATQRPPEKVAAKKAPGKTDTFGGLSKAILMEMHDHMVKSRVLEERLIKIYRTGESFFWIGAPGEEAFGVPLGLHVRKGQGLAYDYLHLHYRGTPTLVAMGMPMIDAIRLMMNKATDPSSGGRNFAGHYCFPKWNVAPVTSPIEVQYPIACGTAHAQKRAGHGSVSIVTGGDAGTAEGDFASSLILASRKGSELPMLLTVQNNKWGISTSFDTQHGEKFVADRARAFQIKSRVIDGNDPVESYICIKEDIDYIRKTGKPAFIEAMVSRLYGHSSASGTNFVEHELDPVKTFESRLLSAGVVNTTYVQDLWSKYEEEGVRTAEKVRTEPVPTAESIWDFTYVNGENADWRKF